MDPRQKLMLQIRAMRAGIDPKTLAKMQKIAVAFFAPVLDGRPALPPQRPAPPKPPAMDGKSVALRALDARQRRAGPDGTIRIQGDPDGPLTGPDTGGNVQKTIELYMAELRKSRQSAAEIVQRAAEKTSMMAAGTPSVPPKPASKALSADEIEDKKRNFLKRWFAK